MLSQLWGGDAAIFRIGQVKGRSGTVVTVDGQLSGEYVRVAEECLLQALAAGRPVSVFLRNVSAVDEAGRALLCRLASQGVSLHASGVYTSYLVKAFRCTGGSVAQTESPANVPGGQRPPREA